MIIHVPLSQYSHIGACIHTQAHTISPSFAVTPTYTQTHTSTFFSLSYIHSPPPPPPPQFSPIHSLVSHPPPPNMHTHTHTECAMYKSSKPFLLFDVTRTQDGDTKIIHPGFTEHSEYLSHSSKEHIKRHMQTQLTPQCAGPTPVQITSQHTNILLQSVHTSGDMDEPSCTAWLTTILCITSQVENTSRNGKFRLGLNYWKIANTIFIHTHTHTQTHLHTHTSIKITTQAHVNIHIYSASK